MNKHEWYIDMKQRKRSELPQALPRPSSAEAEKKAVAAAAAATSLSSNGMGPIRSALAAAVVAAEHHDYLPSLDAALGASSHAKRP